MRRRKGRRRRTKAAKTKSTSKRAKAAQKFAAAADQFQNLVYENADSLQPVAKALDLKVQSAPFMTRAQVQQVAMGSAKFVEALFSPDSVQAKRNTEAIEVAPDALMAGHVVEYKPAAPRPFDAVKDGLSVFSGATILGDGVPALILDVSSLF